MVTRSRWTPGLKNKARPTTHVPAGLKGKARPTLSVLAAGVVFSVIVSGQSKPQVDPCAGARDLRLTNGKIVTMDRGNTTVGEVTIQDGRFTPSGRAAINV